VFSTLFMWYLSQFLRLPTSQLCFSILIEQCRIFKCFPLAMISTQKISPVFKRGPLWPWGNPSWFYLQELYKRTSGSHLTSSRCLNLLWVFQERLMAACLHLPQCWLVFPTENFRVLLKRTATSHVFHPWFLFSQRLFSQLLRKQLLFQILMPLVFLQAKLSLLRHFVNQPNAFNLFLLSSLRGHLLL